MGHASMRAAWRAAQRDNRRDWRLLYDEFTGSGALTAHQPDRGGPWAILNGTFANLSGGVLTYGVPSFNHGCAVAPCGYSDVEISATVNVLNALNVGIVLRSNAAGTNHLLAVFGGSPSKADLYEYTDLTTSVNRLDLAAAAVTAGSHVMTVYAYQEIIRLLCDGTLVGTRSLTSLQANTYHGVGTWLGAVVTWDNLLVVPAGRGWQRIAVIGDSISACTDTSTDASTNWPALVCRYYNGARCYLINHAVAGQSVMANMDAQTAAAASDGANIIITQLGTNDATTDDTLRAEYEENLLELKASNPHARIYAMGILPCNPENNRTTKNTRIATAAANAGVTYWNTDGWIDPATDTSDGLHPTAAGQAKIKVAVLALLPV